MSTNATRRTVKIASHGELLDTWIYSAQGVLPNGEKPPVILLAHGLGGIKTMRLDAFSEVFSAAGFATVVFDYRYSGDSTGVPRGLVDIEKQLEDWDVALEYIVTELKDEVDISRIGIFGTSFGGGHVIRVAAKHGALIKATVSQCPFTDGIASTLCVSGLFSIAKLTLLALKDGLFRSEKNPTLVRLTGAPGELALMNGPDAVPGYHALIPAGLTRIECEDIPARIALTLPFARPGAYASQVKTPILFAICAKDTCAPAKPTLKYAKQAPKGVIKWYDIGHFDVYVGEPFEQASKDYVKFYKANL